MHILDGFTMQGKEAKTGELNFEHKQSWRGILSQKGTQMKDSSQTTEAFLFGHQARGVYHQALVKSEDMFAVCHSRVILAIFAYIFRLVTFGN